MTLPGTPPDPRDSGLQPAARDADAGRSSEDAAPTPETSAEDDLRRVREELEAIDASRDRSVVGSIKGVFGRREHGPAEPSPGASASRSAESPPDVTASPGAQPSAAAAVAAAGSPGTRAAAPSLFDKPPSAAAAPRDDDPSSRRLAYRLETPAEFQTGGETHKTLDWSLGGFAIPPGRHRFKQDQRLQGTFTVKLDDFVVSTPVTVEVVYIDRKRIGCRFTELSHSQIRMLRSLAGALMAGHLPLTIGVGDAARKRRLAQARDKNRSAQPSALVRTMSGLLNGLLAVIVVGIGLFVFFTPIEPTFSAQTGAVAVPRIDIPAPVSGTLVEMVVESGEEVVPGTALGYVRPQNGPRVRFDSDCYCVVRDFAEIGESVREGEPVATLFSSSAQPVVQAVFSRKDEEALVPGRMVVIRLPYAGTTVTGTIESVTSGIEGDWIGMPPAIADVPDAVVAWIEPETALDITAVGEPVTVTFAPSTGL